MEENVTLLAAFGAGLLSFISPCVLPLVPGYLSYVSGLSLDELRGTSARATTEPSAARGRVVVASLAFILGFSLVFVALGATASAAGQFLIERLPILSRLAGAVIILFGLHTMGVLRIEWLYQTKQVQTKRKPAGPIGAMLVGAAFAFGWTPCLGPILAGILAVGASRETVGDAVQLLATYSLGLGVPFLVTGLAINKFFGAMARIRRHYHKIELVSGALLVIIGLLIFTNRFTVIAQWLSPFCRFLETAGLSLRSSVFGLQSSQDNSIDAWLRARRQFTRSGLGEGCRHVAPELLVELVECDAKGRRYGRHDSHVLSQREQQPPQAFRAVPCSNKVEYGVRPVAVGGGKACHRWDRTPGDGCAYHAQILRRPRAALVVRKPLDQKRSSPARPRNDLEREHMRELVHDDASAAVQRLQ